MVGVIDFDTAAPGPRSWDLAHALYRFVPLSGPDHRPARVRRFLDAYGADAYLRERAVADVVPRLRAHIDHMQAAAAAGNEQFARHIAEGHLDLYLRDIAVLESAPDAYRGV